MRARIFDTGLHAEVFLTPEAEAVTGTGNRPDTVTEIMAWISFLREIVCVIGIIPFCLRY